MKPLVCPNCGAEDIITGPERRRACCRSCLRLFTPSKTIIIDAPRIGLLGIFGLTAVILLAKGVGIWGIRIPVGWEWAITNFVWWIGIGRAGTLISAILLLIILRKPVLTALFKKRWLLASQ
jgi:hypothetical protein